MGLFIIFFSPYRRNLGQHFKALIALYIGLSYIQGHLIWLILIIIFNTHPLDKSIHTRYFIREEML